MSDELIRKATSVLLIRMIEGHLREIHRLEAMLDMSEETALEIIGDRKKRIEEELLGLSEITSVSILDDYVSNKTI